jgi:hypothetical protein
MKNKITFKNMRKLTGLQSIGSPEQSVAIKLDNVIEKTFYLKIVSILRTMLKVGSFLILITC